MSVFKEFKEFAVKGNVADMAVGIIIGADFAVFLLIKAINRLKRKDHSAPPAPRSNQELLLTEIRDLLKKR